MESIAQVTGTGQDDEYNRLITSFIWQTNQVQRKFLAMNTAILVVLLFISTAVFGQDDFGAICVAPIPHNPPSTAATPELFCKSGNFSYKIDTQPPVAWQKDKSTTVTGLNPKGNHGISVFCDGKPLQSFKFRLSEYRAGKACLFMNDMYWTAQLWELKQAPWCKCQQ